MIFSPFLVMGQAGYSPYTSIGIGDIHELGLTNNIGMGGVGISNGGGLFYNNANPALLYRNSLSVFAIGMAWEYKQVSTSDLSQENYTGGFNYAMIGLPIMVNRWTLGLGIMPYSTVNYKYNVTEKFMEAAEVFKSHQGSGGFNKAFVSNGIKITENFSMGLTLGYLFGSIKNEVTTQVATTREINDSTSITLLSNSVSTGKRLTIGDLYLMGGLAYRLPLSKETFLNAGLTYELGGKKDTKLFQNIRNLSYQENTNFANDTISETQGSIKLPSTLGIGFSYEETYHWTVGVDLLLRDWSNYEGYVTSGENGNGEMSEGFENNYSIAVGAEYIPDIASVDSYLKRMAYRIGFRHERSPFRVNQEYINDFGINFGVSLPVRSFSSFDLSFQLGQRGTTDKNLIKERYFKVYLGVTFNDKWFVRRKFD